MLPAMSAYPMDLRPKAAAQARIGRAPAARMPPGVVRAWCGRGAGVVRASGVVRPASLPIGGAMTGGPLLGWAPGMASLPAYPIVGVEGMVVSVGAVLCHLLP